MDHNSFYLKENLQLYLQNLIDVKLETSTTLCLALRSRLFKSYFGPINFKPFWVYAPI